MKPSPRETQVKETSETPVALRAPSVSEAEVPSTPDWYDPSRIRRFRPDPVEAQRSPSCPLRPIGESMALNAVPRRERRQRLVAAPPGFDDNTCLSLPPVPPLRHQPSVRLPFHRRVLPSSPLHGQGEHGPRGDSA